MTDIHSPYRADFTVIDTEEYKRLQALQEEVARLKEVIEWYSDEDNYKHPALLHPRNPDGSWEVGDKERKAIEIDYGQRARRALGIVLPDHYKNEPS